MLTLTIRTDKPEAEVGLYIDGEQVAYDTWTAHRQLAETLHARISGLLDANGKNLQDLDAIACYSGPGSFTGLRIGLTVANALAYSLEIPIAAGTGDDWHDDTVAHLENGESDPLAMPEYGAPVNITLPR